MRRERKRHPGSQNGMCKGPVVGSTGDPKVVSGTQRAKGNAT